MLDVKLEELRVVLESIKKLREAWVQAVDLKTVELLDIHPNISVAEARNRALLAEEVHGKFIPLIALYGVIGADAAGYLQAVNSVVPDATVLPFKRDAA